MRFSFILCSPRLVDHKPTVYFSRFARINHLDKAHIQLEVIDIIPTPAATHFRYRVVK